MVFEETIWPGVAVDGDLERARDEWLHTNGAGAYASSTVAQLHSRRYHGLLVAALDPPRRRHVILSHMDATVHAGTHRYELDTHQFPGVVPTPGYRHLARFDQDPLPRWTFQLPEGELEQTLALVRGENAAVLRYTWHGAAAVEVRLRPLMALRPFHALVREHGSMIQSVELRQAEVRVRPVPALPRVVFGHTATFIGSPDWWRRFEYLAEQGRGLDFQEDLWTPGTFAVRLLPHTPAFIVVAVEALPRGAPSQLMADAARVVSECDPGSKQTKAVRVLSVARDAFLVKNAKQEQAIIAGYPWFEVWGRDTLIALPGLLLVQHDLDGARAILRTIIQQMQDGLVPNRLPDEGRPAEYHTADATLWLFEAARLYAEQVDDSDAFLGSELLGALASAFEAVQAGTRHNIHLTADGLYAAADAGFALTWMDAKVGQWAVTPRAGVPVELCALWTRGCDTLARLADAYGHPELATRARFAHERALAAFRRRFWCTATGYPYDVVSEVEGAWNDESIRPNALIALAVEPRLFDEAQTSSILRVVERDLLTPAGLRTLSPRCPGYVERYSGSLKARDAAYHQGTVWPFLLGFYARAAMRVAPRDETRRARLRALVAGATHNTLALGQVPEVADAAFPHAPGGCVAQAWSVAELLRALVWDLA